MYIYGKHACIAALKNPRRKFIKIYCTKSLEAEIKQLTTKYEIIDQKFLDKLIGLDKNHQGIVIHAQKLESISLEELLKNIQNKKHSTIVCLDQVNDPQNIGAILRNCAAFAVDALIITKHNSPDQTSSAIAKTSSGAIETTPMIIVTNLSQTLQILKKSGYWCYGFALEGKDKKNLYEEKFENKAVLVFGSEHSGLRRLTAECVDFIVKIPMSQINSLNVASSSAIALSWAYSTNNIHNKSH